jgi:hypothetical protein
MLVLIDDVESVQRAEKIEEDRKDGVASYIMPPVHMGSCKQHVKHSPRRSSNCLMGINFVNRLSERLSSKIKHFLP